MAVRPWLQSQHTVTAGKGRHFDHFLYQLLEAVRAASESHAKRRRDAAKGPGGKADHNGRDGSSDDDQSGVPLQKAGNPSAFPKKAADQCGDSGQNADDRGEIHESFSFIIRFA
ncbi:hypothetical protein D3C87_1687050 [compost metagenome]